jgi:hypothetical protein
MQINSDNNLISRLAGDSPLVQQGSQGPAPSRRKDAAALGERFGEILSKALNAPENRLAVEQAKRDLKEGRLENDAAFEQAAENFLKYGL